MVATSTCRCRRAVGVEHDAHLDALLRPLRECLRHAPAELAFLPEERLVVDRLLRHADALDQHVPEFPVLEDLDRVAAHGGAQRDAGQRRHQALDADVAFDLEVRVLVGAHRPEHEAEHHHQDEENRDGRAAHCPGKVH
jgi:hypothetical protein